MKKIILLTIAGIVLFAVFLFAKVPAAQVIPRLPLPEHLSISQISGSIWNGHANQVIFKGLQLSDVNWRLSFLPLLMGKASFDVDAGSIRDSEQIAIKGNIVLTTQGISGNDTKLYAPTPLLLAQVELPLPVYASGRVLIEIDELHYLKTGCQSLSGKGQWLNGAVEGLDQKIALGNFEADLSCDKGPIELIIAPDNTLSLSGTATVDHKGKLSASGKFKVPSEFPKQVRDAANMFSPPDNRGFHTISL